MEVGKVLREGLLKGHEFTLGDLLDHKEVVIGAHEGRA